MINLPEQAPFDESDRAALAKMLGSWSEPQCQWLAGFLAGLSAGTGSTQTAGSGGGSLLVLYGTESGNSEELAARTTKAAKGAKERGPEADGAKEREGAREREGRKRRRSSSSSASRSPPRGRR